MVYVFSDVSSIRCIPTRKYFLLFVFCLFIIDQSTGFLYLNASDQYKGDKARLQTRYILPTYNCMKFSYHMDGRQMGKLSVFSKLYQGKETLLWRLFGKQSNEWQQGEIPINSTDVFKVCGTGGLRTGSH